MAQRRKSLMLVAATLVISFFALICSALIVLYKQHQIPSSTPTTYSKENTLPNSPQTQHTQTSAPPVTYVDQTFGIQLSLPEGWTAQPLTLFSGDHRLQIFAHTPDDHPFDDPSLTFAAAYTYPSYARPPLVANPKVYYTESSEPNEVDVRKILAWHMTSIDTVSTLVADVEEQHLGNTLDARWSPMVRFYVFNHGFKEQNETRLMEADVTYNPQECKDQTRVCAPNYTLALDTIYGIVASLRFTR